MYSSVMSLLDAGDEMGNFGFKGESGKINSPPIFEINRLVGVKKEKSNENKSAKS